ncbi:hypothetical protein [Candidatus Coxiella mudrowiae]|uniref:hypothetical protein n=1 Tax=Candidatus Coxiella mudrowiae TaxID=2054173 RepID=UPI000C2890CF|nr:hypothetical protein [Candidatus Coxiella mudrowiae]
MFYDGKTSILPLNQLERLGYQLVIITLYLYNPIPFELQRAAIAAMQKTLAFIKQNRDSQLIASELTYL